MLGPSSAIVLICPERLIRELLAFHLCACAGENTITSAASFAEATQNDVPEDAVLVFIDIGYASRDLIDCIRQARETLPDTPIALVSDFLDRRLISRAFELGVKGFIPTSMSIQTVVPSLRLLLAGGDVMPPTLLRETSHLGEYIDGHGGAPLVPNQIPLTEREREVLFLICQGKPNKSIAAELNLDETVVKNNVRNLMRKTHTRNRVELALAFGQGKPHAF